MTQRVDDASFRCSARRSNSVSLGSALFLTVLVIAGLGALAFWPSWHWSPPHRPGLAAPIVFDEFVKATNAAPEASNPGVEAAP